MGGTSHTRTTGNEDSEMGNEETKKRTGNDRRLQILSRQVTASV